MIADSEYCFWNIAMLLQGIFLCDLAAVNIYDMFTEIWKIFGVNNRC